MMREVVGFLRSKSSPGKPASKVGMLCSPAFIHLIQGQLPMQYAFLFQLMLFGTSFSHIYSNQATSAEGISVPLLQLLGAHAGHQILRLLDRELQPQQLAAASFEKIRVLFFLVFGTILALRHCTRISLSQDHPSACPMEQDLWDKMRQYLTEITAHFLVLLGSYANVQFTKDEEYQLLHYPTTVGRQSQTYKWTPSVSTTTVQTAGSGTLSYSCTPHWAGSGCSFACCSMDSSGLYTCAFADTPYIATNLYHGKYWCADAALTCNPLCYRYPFCSP